MQAGESFLYSYSGSTLCSSVTMVAGFAKGRGNGVQDEHTLGSASQLVRAASGVAIITVASNILGFVREASLAAVFGASYATDAYLMSYSIPHLVFGTLSYALATTFIPVYSSVRQEDGEEAGLRFANTVLWIVLSLSTLIVVLGELFAEVFVRLVAPGFTGEVAELTVFLTRIMFPVMIIELLSGLSRGILHADGRFLVVSTAALTQNLSIIIAILGFGPRFGITSVAVGAVVGVAIPYTLEMIVLHKSGFRWQAGGDVSHHAVQRMAVLAFPAVLSAGAMQLNALVDKILASGLPEGRVAAYSYATRLMQLAPTIIGSSIITVVYPTLARQAAARQWREFGHAAVGAINTINFLLAPVAVGVLIFPGTARQIRLRAGSF